MRETLSGERLYAVNLVRLLEVGTPMILEAVLGVSLWKEIRKE